MACTVTGSIEGDRALASQETQQLLTRTTQMLCALSKAAEASGVTFPPEAAAWWAEHKEIDRKRDLREQEEQRVAQVRKDALAKLSPEERSALKV